MRLDPDVQSITHVSVAQPTRRATVTSAAARHLRYFAARRSRRMLIVLHPDITPQAQAAIEARIRELGFVPHAIEGAGRTAIGITGNKGPIDPGHFRLLEGVADTIPVTAPYKLVSREVKHDDTVVDVGGVPVGGRELVIMAGPCAVENEKQILTAARGVAQSGAAILRGGAFKPRTS